MNGGSPGIQFLSFHRLHICSDHRPLFVGPTVDRTNSLPRPRWANVKQLPAGQKDNSLSEFGNNRSPDAFSSNSIQFQEVTLSENVVIKPNSKGFSLFFTLKCITILHTPCVGSPLCVQRAATRKPLLAPSMLLYHEQSAAGWYARPLAQSVRCQMESQPKNLGIRLWTVPAW